MIVSGTHPPITIDLGNDAPGMTLQYRDVKDGYVVWRDCQVDGEAVKSPVDIDALPPGNYRLRAKVLGLIIDEPRNAGTDLAASQAWLKELEDLAAQGFDVEYYLARAKELVRQAEDTPQLHAGRESGHHV